jgi:hypothetical protein
MSCKKEGPPGKDGKDGNPTVISSLVTVNSGQWTYQAPSYHVNIQYSAITQDIINKGAVLVYNQYNNTSTALPYTAFYPNYSRLYDFTAYNGGLYIYVTDSDLTQPSNPGNLQFKIVVIPSSSLPLYNIDLADYNQVVNYYNLN